MRPAALAVALLLAAGCAAPAAPPPPPGPSADAGRAELAGCTLLQHVATVDAARLGRMLPDGYRANAVGPAAQVRALAYFCSDARVGTRGLHDVDLLLVLATADAPREVAIPGADNYVLELVASGPFAAALRAHGFRVVEGTLARAPSPLGAQAVVRADPLAYAWEVAGQPAPQPKPYEKGTRLHQEVEGRAVFADLAEAWEQDRLMVPASLGAVGGALGALASPAAALPGLAHAGPAHLLLNLTTGEP